MKTIIALAALLAAVTVGFEPAMAEQSASYAAKQTHAKKHVTKKKSQAADEGEKEPEIVGMQPTSFDCELGNKITIYRQQDDDQHIALHWNKRTHTLTRVATVTGANRFEDAKSGLVWIGIPAKSMLLDSKKGQQLANECKSAEQIGPKVAGH